MNEIFKARAARLAAIRTIQQDPELAEYVRRALSGELPWRTIERATKAELGAITDAQIEELAEASP